MQKIDTKAGTERTFIQTLIELRWTYKAALAASVILITFTFAWLIFKPDPTRQLISEIQQITSSDLVEFDGYLVNFDESLVDEWIDRKGEGIRSAMVDSASLDEVSGADIMNYLLAEYSPDELNIEP